MHNIVYLVIFAVCIGIVIYYFRTKLRSSVARYSQKLLENHQKYRDILDNIHDGYYEIDLSGNIKSVNKSLCEILGFSRDELIGNTYENLIDPSTYIELKRIFVEVFRTGRPLRGHAWEHTRGDGKTFYVESSVSLVRDENGIAVGFQGIVRNITDRKLEEESIRYKEEQLRLLLNIIPDCISFKDAEGRWILANDMKLQLHHIETVPYKGKTDEELAEYAKVGKEIMLRCKHTDEATWRLGSELHFEECVLLPDGTVKTFDVVKVPIYRRDGSRKGLLVVGRDITIRKVAEQKVAESEQRYRSLVDMNSDAVVSFDSEGYIQSVNNVASMMTGYNESELIGAHLSIFLAQGEIERANRNFTYVLEGNSHEIFYECVHKTGKRLELSIKSMPIVVNQKIVGVFAIIKDFTERNRLQRENEWLSKKNELILKSAGEGIYGVDKEGIITFCNPAAAQMLGYTVDELIGLHSHNTLHHTKADGTPYPWHQCPTNRLMLTGEVHRCVDDVLWRKDGSFFAANYTTTPIIQDGEILGSVITFNDITEQLSMRKKYERLSHQYQMMFDSVGEGVCGTDIQGNIVFCNPAILRMTGYEPHEIVGQPLHELLHHTRANGDSLPKSECPSYRAHRNGQSYRAIDEIFWRKDGTSFSVEFLVSPIVEDGRTVGSVLLVQDVTERKRAEEMLLKSAKLSVVGQLAAGVAHEIRNPLTALKGFVQLLAMKTGGNETYFTIMKSELNRIETIVDEFLVLAKPQRTDFQLHNPGAVMHNVIHLLEPQATVNNVQLKMYCATDVPRVHCDENRLKQVFVNLLKNAIEAMPYGGIVNIDLAISSTHSGYVSIRIIDEGDGIPEEWVSKLGEPFYTTKVKGTGLGLMVTHKIIESHQGVLRIDSELGKGTTVEILLPIPKDIELDGAGYFTAFVGETSQPMVDEPVI